MPEPSRRKFAVLLATPGLLGAQATVPEDLDALARGQIKANSTRLSQFKIDMDTEPAFAFKP